MGGDIFLLMLDVFSSVISKKPSFAGGFIACMCKYIPLLVFVGKLAFSYNYGNQFLHM